MSVIGPWNIPELRGNCSHMLLEIHFCRTDFQKLLSWFPFKLSGLQMSTVENCKLKFFAMLTTHPKLYNLPNQSRYTFSVYFMNEPIFYTNKGLSENYEKRKIPMRTLKIDQTSWKAVPKYVAPSLYTKLWYIKVRVLSFKNVYTEIGWVDHLHVYYTDIETDIWMKRHGILPITQENNNNTRTRNAELNRDGSTTKCPRKCRMYERPISQFRVRDGWDDGFVSSELS